jgi:hypothetical protein
MARGIEIDVCEVIEKLRSFGINLCIENGVVRGRMCSGKIPFEARAWIERLQLVNEAATELLMQEIVHERLGITVAEALPYAERIKRGEIALVGKVIYHKAADQVDIRWKELNKDEN